MESNKVTASRISPARISLAWMVFCLVIFIAVHGVQPGPIIVWIAATFAADRLTAHLAQTHDRIRRTRNDDN